MTIDNHEPSVKGAQIQNGFLRAWKNDRCGFDTPSEREAVLSRCDQDEEPTKRSERLAARNDRREHHLPDEKQEQPCSARQYQPAEQAKGDQRPSSA